MKMGVLISVLSLMLVTLLFQNCSDVAFDSIDASSLAGKVESEDELQNQDPIDENAEADDYAVDCEEKTQIHSSQIHAKYVNVAPGSSFNHLRGSFALSSSSFYSISDFRGSLKLKTSSVELLQNGRGSLVVASSQNNSIIKKLADHRGHVRICGLSMDSIENLRGHLLVIGGQIEKINDFRGHVILINGSIRDIHNFRGSVRLINSRILGTVTDFEGQIKEK